MMRLSVRLVLLQILLPPFACLLRLLRVPTPTTLPFQLLLLLCSQAKQLRLARWRPPRQRRAGAPCPIAGNQQRDVQARSPTLLGKRFASDFVAQCFLNSRLGSRQQSAVIVMPPQVGRSLLFLQRAGWKVDSFASVCGCCSCSCGHAGVSSLASVEGAAQGPRLLLKLLSHARPNQAAVANPADRRGWHQPTDV